MNCPRCTQALSETARFCSSCGYSTSLANAPTVSIGAHETAEDARKADGLVGRVLDGKYELIERLGGGGMGTVYRARRVHIGDEVAVKVLRAEFVLEADAVERFRREARSAAMIRHANVVAIHDLSEARGPDAPAYIVMELVRGNSLRELLQREGRLAPERAVALMRDICAGVGVAHRLGLVHRDLKPDNVIVAPPDETNERETAKVVDFGLAHARDMAADLRLTQTGTVLGTPYYMSPEQCRGDELDARADVYSLGALCYEMLAGSPPFTANSLAGLIAKHLSDAPPALPPQLGVPPALEAVCRRALAKNPADRQADATILNREIQAALLPPTVAYAPRAVEASSTSTPAESSVPVAPSLNALPTQSHRGKWIAAALLLSVLGALITGAAIYLNRNRADSNANVAQPNLNRAATPIALSDQTATANATSTPAPDNEAAETPTPQSGQGLTGKWTGTYGPMGQPATLTVKAESGGKLSGVLAQGSVRVAFVGSVDAATRQVTLKETRVLSGSDWSLGANTGTLSADGRTMSGTGGDAYGSQLGLSYAWSFAKQ
ncbi:MAG: protein kinase domain-containing protein [Pyrinomonadaceae bacterium]